jgi:hypothetical protein
VVYERVYALGGSPTFLHGSVDEQPVLPSGGAEVFVLRKMLPQTLEYDFNIHIMDFKPGEHLVVKVRCWGLGPGLVGAVWWVQRVQRVRGVAGPRCQPPSLACPNMLGMPLTPSPLHALPPCHRRSTTTSTAW